MHESVRALGGGSVLRAADVDVGQARSPHLTWRPEQIDVGLDDVKGLGPLREEVTETLNLFLGYATFKDRLGGTPGGASCSRASRAPARPTWPRRWPATPGCRRPCLQRHRRGRDDKLRAGRAPPGPGRL